MCEGGYLGRSVTLWRRNGTREEAGSREEGFTESVGSFPEGSAAAKSSREKKGREGNE